MKWSPSLWLIGILVSLFYDQILSVVVFNPGGQNVFAMFWNDFGDHNPEHTFMDSKNWYRLHAFYDEISLTGVNITSSVCYNIADDLEKYLPVKKKLIEECQSQTPDDQEVMQVDTNHFTVKVLECKCFYERNSGFYEPFYIKKRIDKNISQYYYLRKKQSYPFRLIVEGIYDVSTSQLFIRTIPNEYAKIN